MDADETIRQLGGRAIFAMAFKAPAVLDDRTLRLRIAPALRRAAKGATHVTVTLAGNDTYTVEVVTYNRAYIPRVLAEETGIYADQLRGCVERMTGLYLSL